MSTEHSPTPEQSAIISMVAMNPNQSIIVDARAGAAKTSTIIMAASGISVPTLCLAFNKKIQLELQERIGESKFITCKTLNAIGLQAWTARLAKRCNIDGDKMYAIAREVVGMREDEALSDALNLARRAKSAGLIPQGSPRAATPSLPQRTWRGRSPRAR